jgi:predicted nucleic acid-binding protein
MILVDTCIWIDYLNAREPLLLEMIEGNYALLHSMVLGEIALGNLKSRADVLEIFGDIPQIKSASDEEVLAAIGKYQLMGKGIGWVDAHLLVAVLQSEGIKLWTRDKRLNSLAQELNLTVDF